MVSYQDDPKVVEVLRAEAKSSVVLICEHASNHIPPDLNELGLDSAARNSHVAWDPGAFAVAAEMSNVLNSALIASMVSRLVYDCNRPLTAPGAILAHSEVYAIPGNAGLTDAQRHERFIRYYTPFQGAVAAEIARRLAPVIVTIHSFAPVYHGQRREVEIGILHDADSRLADAMLDMDQPFDVRRNVPYGPQDGVTHTLKEHAINDGHLNVMIEIRNDLIADAQSQTAMAKTLAEWLERALETIGDTTCRA